MSVRAHPFFILLLGLLWGYTVADLRRMEIPLPRVLIITLLLLGMARAQSPVGSVCVAPVPKGWKSQAPPSGISCEASKITLSIDGKAARKWPQSTSLLIEDLELTQRHQVVVSCNGKPQQSFRFGFPRANSKSNSKKMCLFLNDLYNTVNLWRDETALCECQ